jgi:hypothetical protein
VTLVLLPKGTTVEQVAEAGLSPGLLSAGLGAVPPDQTYLDITQGNRVFDSLYDTALPPLGRDCSAWNAVVSRADSAPADVVPGLLAATLRRSGAAVRVGGEASCTFSAPPSSDGRAGSTKKLSGTPHTDGQPTLEVRSANLREVSSLLGTLGGDDLLIAIETPPPPENQALAIGIAGDGLDGNLTSDSTRIDGYLLSTDVAPTVLDAFGIEAPSEMSGQTIRSEGEVDPAAVEELGERMARIPERRGPVIGFALLAWSVLLGLAAAGSRGRLARPGVRVVGLAVVYLPLLLLLGAAFEAGQGVEQLLVIFGAPLLGALTLATLGGYRALASASALTVIAYAADVLAGSPLTSLSLLGPNPGLGVRFYGIGNELEALLAVLVVAGTGAALSGFAPHASSRAQVASFLASGLIFAFVFAAGRFGADVGAAIVLPLGAAVAAAAVSSPRLGAETAGRSRLGWAVLAVGIPVAAVALLALIDLLSGADAHLTRSVLDAGGLDQLSEVAQRRLQLSAHSFERPIVYVFLPLIAAVAVLAYVWRDRIASWLRGAPALGAGLAGALAATLVGTLANDSGALLLEIGSAYLLVFIGFAWAEADDPDGRYP